MFSVKKTGLFLYIIESYQRDQTALVTGYVAFRNMQASAGDKNGDTKGEILLGTGAGICSMP